MMDFAPNNSGLENRPRNLTDLFKKDLLALRGFFSEEVLSLVENNIGFLMKDYVAWQRALVAMTKKLGVEYENISDIPGVIEKTTFENIKKKFSAKSPQKIVLGIAGPGAVGKETVKKDLGFNVVVNTTTRPKRDYESHGEHYHFVSDAEFNSIALENGFIVSMKREGRGQYGIRKEDIEKVLSRSKVAIIEENPVNLTGLTDYLKTYENCELILVYILPPSLVLPNLAARLANRCLKSGNNFRSAFDSTLNLRQLQEFNSMADSMNKNANVLFLVNDDIKRVVKKIKDLIE